MFVSLTWVSRVCTFLFGVQTSTDSKKNVWKPVKWRASTSSSIVHTCTRNHAYILESRAFEPLIASRRSTRAQRIARTWNQTGHLCTYDIRVCLRLKRRKTKINTAQFMAFVNSNVPVARQAHSFLRYLA